MKLSLKIKNGSDKPIQLGEFATGSVRFFNKAVPVPEQSNTESVVATEGLSLDNPAPIQPGEQRCLSFGLDSAALAANFPAHETKGIRQRRGRHRPGE